jgi:hypothetical protein
MVAEQRQPVMQDGMKATYDQYQLSGDPFEAALQLVGKRSFEMTAHQMCGLVDSDNPEGNPCTLPGRKVRNSSRLGSSRDQGYGSGNRDKLIPFQNCAPLHPGRHR